MFVTERFTCVLPTVTVIITDTAVRVFCLFRVVPANHCAAIVLAVQFIKKTHAAFMSGHI